MWFCKHNIHFFWCVHVPIGALSSTSPINCHIYQIYSSSLAQKVSIMVAPLTHCFPCKICELKYLERMVANVRLAIHEESQTNADTNATGNNDGAMSYAEPPNEGCKYDEDADNMAAEEADLKALEFVDVTEEASTAIVDLSQDSSEEDIQYDEQCLPNSSTSQYSAQGSNSQSSHLKITEVMSVNAMKNDNRTDIILGKGQKYANKNKKEPISFFKRRAEITNRAFDAQANNYIVSDQMSEGQFISDQVEPQINSMQKVSENGATKIFDKSLNIYSTPAKPFKCDKCNFCAGIEARLKVHKSIAHRILNPMTKKKITTQNFQYSNSILKNSAIFPCVICTLEFKTSYSLETHIRRVHHVKQYQCKHCGMSFKHKYSLPRHVKHFHNKH